MTRRALTLVPFLLLASVLRLRPSAIPRPPRMRRQTPTPRRRQNTKTPDAAVFDERAAAAVLGTIRDGLEGHSPRRLLSAFDADKMDGFLTFQDQIDAYFTPYEAIRVTLRILQTSEENDRGVILADFQMENDRATEAASPPPSPAPLRTRARPQRLEDRGLRSREGFFSTKRSTLKP